MSDELLKTLFELRENGHHPLEIYWAICLQQTWYEEAAKYGFKERLEELEKVSGYTTIEEPFREIDEIAKAQVDKDRPLGWFKK